MSAWKWSGCAVGFKGFQSMGREAAKKVEGLEIRRTGDFVTYSKLMGKAGKGSSFVFLKLLYLLL